jgi:gas vesicle protein
MSAVFGNNAGVTEAFKEEIDYLKQQNSELMEKLANNQEFMEEHINIRGVQTGLEYVKEDIEELKHEN